MNDKNKLLLVRLVIFGILSVFFISGTATASPTLSNSGGGTWEYYKEVTISENSGTTLTDYHVLVQLSGNDFPTNTRFDGADIRFTDANENELNYWVESWDYSAKNAKIWVKVPSIEGGGSTIIRLYYGNPIASSSSNGDSTFILFDDFLVTNLDTNKWVEWNSPTYTISNGLITFTSNDDITVHRGLLSLNQFTTDFIIETRGKTYSDKFFPYVGVAIEQHNEANDRRGISTGYYHNEHDNFYNTITECQDADSCTINDINRFEIPEQDNDWLLITTKKSGTSIETRIYNERTKNTYDNSKSIVYSHDEHHLGLSIYRITKSDYDWICVRKYASSEPSAYFGTEQSVMTPTITPTITPTPTITVTPVPTPQPTATSKDSDGDGWSDEQERTAGTNPFKVDTDGDGIWDSKDSNPLVVEKHNEPVESNVNVNVENSNINTNTNENSSIATSYIGIGVATIFLVGIIGFAFSRKGGSSGSSSASTNIHIGKVGDSADHVSNDYSTTTNVDNRDGVMQRSNIGASDGIDEKLVALKEKYDKGLISEHIYNKKQEELLDKL